MCSIAQQARSKRRQHLQKERLESTATENRVTVQTDTAVEESFRAFQEYVKLQLDYSLDRKYLLILRSANASAFNVNFWREEAIKHTEFRRDKKQMIVQYILIKEIGPFYAQIIELCKGSSQQITHLTR